MLQNGSWNALEVCSRTIQRGTEWHGGGGIGPGTAWKKQLQAEWDWIGFVEINGRFERWSKGSSMC